MKNKQSNIICLKMFAFLAFAMLLIAIPASAQGASYVGKDVCKNCHQTEYNKIQNSIHQKMIREASIPGNVHGNLSDPNAPKLSEICK